MHNLINSYYIRTLIRVFKEFNVFNSDVKHKLLEEVLPKIKDLNGRVYPHLLVGEFSNVPILGRIVWDVDKFYLSLVSDKLISDIDNLLKSKNKKYDRDKLIKELKKKYLFMFLTECGMSSEEIDEGVLEFYK